ncbi:MAG: hypothetical protein RL325_1355 [Planctomycetota bacterium]|jgi:hypothetical protein
MTAASNFQGVPEGLPGGWLASRRTLVLVGNLPVMNGLWLSQYADREARENGPTCLVRLSVDNVQLELFRAGSRRPTVRPQARCDEALRTIAPVVAHWLIVPKAGDPVEIPEGTDDIVVLTGADQTAILAAYRLVKAAHEAAERLGGTRPAISVAVLGADNAETAHVAARIGEAASQSLSINIPVRGGLQRVAPAESSFRGTFDEAAPSLPAIAAVISEVVSSPRAAAVEPEPAPLRFVPRVERKAPAAIPFRAEMPPTPPRGGRGTEPVRTAPVRAAVSVRPSVEESREILEEASATLREASVAAAGATRAPYTASAVAGPSVSPPVARLVEGGLPQSLVPFVDGLARVDHAAPRCERIEFAVGSDGRLHLVCRIADLRMLERARAWLRENGALFRRAFPEIAAGEDPAVDVFVEDLRDLEQIEGATVRVIRQLEFAGRRCFDVQTLSA